jgi:hypothetical protein
MREARNMVKELLNPVDQTASAAESAPSALHKQAVSEFLKAQPTSNADVPTVGGANPGVEASAQNRSGNIEKSVPQERSAGVAPNDLVATKSSAAGSEASESGKLTPELKSAVDNSAKVIVKMSTANTEGADLVIKRDGSIVQYLNMDPNKDGSKNLTVSLEKGSGNSLSKEQAEALKELVAYTKTRNKEFSVEAPPTSPLKPTPNTAESASQEIPAGSPGQRPGAPEASSAGRSGVESCTGRSYSNPGASPERSANHGTGGDTGYRSSAQRDWSQVDLAELLMEWFGADPETFKRLMPELYKKIAGANGKIDPKKLRQLQESNDPLLGSVKNQLPLFAEVFPPTQGSSGAVSASGDAVSATGAKLSDAANQVSDELPGSGYCAKGVSFAIERATGIVIGGHANDMRESLPDHGFTVANSKDLKVGQVVHVYWTPEVFAQEQAENGREQNIGDIAVITRGKDGKLYAANDNKIPLDNYLDNDRYAWNTLKVFNPPVA